MSREMSLHYIQRSSRNVRHFYPKMSKKFVHSVPVCRCPFFHLFTSLFFFLNKKNVKSTVCLLLGWWKSANIRSQWKTDSVFYLQWVRFHRSHRLLQKWIQLDIMQATVTQVARILIRFHNHFTWILKHFEHYIVQESTKRWKLFPLLSKSMTNLWSYNT